jgi:hypothetical protein
MACWEAWQHRMVALQALPALPESQLQGALPNYRNWLTELAGMHRAWMSVTADGSNLLDPMMPWRWLEMGYGLWENAVAATAQQPAAQQQTLPQLTPYAPMKQQPAQYLPQQNPSAPAQKEAKDLAQRNVPLAPKDRPSVDAPIHQDSPKLQPAQVQEKTAGNWPFAEQPSVETGKQVIFRGLDDFASFVQTPMPPAIKEAVEEPTLEAAQYSPETVAHGQLNQLEPPKMQAQVEGLQQSLFTQLQDAFAALQAVHPVQQSSTPSDPTAVDEAMETLQKDAKPQDQPQQQVTNSPSQLLAPSPLPQGQRKPFLQSPVAKDSTLEGPVTPQSSEERPAHLPVAPQDRNVKGESQDSPVHSNRPTGKMSPVGDTTAWEQVHAQWEQLTQPPVGQQHAQPLGRPVHRKATTSAPQVQAAPIAHERPATALQQVMQGPLQPMHVLENTHSPSTLPEPLAQQVWPTKGPAAAPLQDQERLVEEFMAAMTEQLQRDFKRYYGA